MGEVGGKRVNDEYSKRRETGSTHSKHSERGGALSSRLADGPSSNEDESSTDGIVITFQRILPMANVIAPDALVSQLRWRYATKRFDTARKIPDQDWAALEEALILTPSSYGLQPWKFVVITDPAVKAQLPAISWNQKQVQDASHTVV